MQQRNIQVREKTPISWTPTYWGFFMTKYSEQFKLAVVKNYLTGSAAYKTMGKRHHIDWSMVSK
jgi:transposase-like protein